jgi:hypothetical protein
METKQVLKGMFEEIKRIDKVIKLEVEQERESIEEHREPLSIEKEEVLTILLSWGGGSDGFKLYFKDKELIKGLYFMADWGEYEEVELNEEELRKVYDFYLYGEF